MTDLDPRSELAARVFPKEWAVIADVPGKSKARTNLRRRAEVHVKIQELRREGKSCVSCGSFCVGGPFGAPAGSYCEMDTDFYGYAMTGANDLCTRWHAQKTEAAL